MIRNGSNQVIDCWPERMGQLLSLSHNNFRRNPVISLFFARKRMRRIKTGWHLFLFLCLANIARPFINYVGAQNEPSLQVLPSQFRAFVARAAPTLPTVTLQQRQLRDTVNDVNFVGIPPGHF